MRGKHLKLVEGRHQDKDNKIKTNICLSFEILKDKQ